MKTYAISDNSYPGEIWANNIQEAAEKASRIITSVDEWNVGDRFDFLIVADDESEELNARMRVSGDGSPEIDCYNHIIK